SVVWFRSPHDELAAEAMRTSEPPHWLLNRNKAALGRTRHEALRLDRTESAHCPRVHGGERQRDAEADRRSAWRRESAGGAPQRHPARPDAAPGARRRPLRLRDPRDLRVSGGKAPEPADDRIDAGGARRMPDVDAAARPQHRRAARQWLPLWRCTQVLREADSRRP